MGKQTIYVYDKDAEFFKVTTPVDGDGVSMSKPVKQIEAFILSPEEEAEFQQWKNKRKVTNKEVWEVAASIVSAIRASLDRSPEEFDNSDLMEVESEWFFYLKDIMDGTFDPETYMQPPILNKENIDENYQQWKSGGWVSVEERLPERGESPKYSNDLLCWIPSPNSFCFKGRYCFMDKTWYDIHGDEMECSHWQPLPTPPTNQ